MKNIEAPNGYKFLIDNMVVSNITTKDDFNFNNLILISNKKAKEIMKQNEINSENENTKFNY